jgi:hypothetical protein
MSRSRISFPRAVVMPRMREHNIDFVARKSGRESNDPSSWRRPPMSSVFMSIRPQRRLLSVLMKGLRGALP